ncbi:MAG: cell division protein FtsA [Polyangiales bacterium]
MGVALVDIGGGTTDVVVYVDGALVHTAVFPIGGMNLTHDIATGLRTPEGEAERIKLRYACALCSMVDPDEVIEVPGVGGRASRTLPRQFLASITEPRMEEIFRFVAKVLHESGNAELLGAGVVITGGASLLEGTLELAEAVLQLPVRQGTPSGIGGMVEMVRSPAMSTAVGLLKYGATRPHRAAAPAVAPKAERPGVARAEPAGPGVGTRLWKWINEVL